MLNYNQ